MELVIKRSLFLQYNWMYTLYWSPAIDKMEPALSSVSSLDSHGKRL